LEVSKFVDDPKKFVSPALLSKVEKEFALTFVVDLWRIRVGKDLTLCELLNREYDTFVVWPNLGIKSCV
jgi:hypothetical protein